MTDTAKDNNFSAATQPAAVKTEKEAPAPKTYEKRTNVLGDTERRLPEGYYNFVYGITVTTKDNKECKSDPKGN